MVSEFKFFQKNPYKDKCRLIVGSSFIFQGYYCIVMNMYNNDFKFLKRETGFSCYVNDKYIYDIGTPQSSVDAYEFDTTAGIYQAFLHHFFGYELTKWNKLHFRRKIIR